MLKTKLIERVSEGEEGLAFWILLHHLETEPDELQAVRDYLWDVMRPLFALERDDD